MKPHLEAEAKAPALRYIGGMNSLITSYRPAFTKRFWFKLTLVYTVVSVFAIKMLLSVFDTVDHYRLFKEAMQPATFLNSVTERLRPIQRLIESGALNMDDIANTAGTIDDLLVRESLTQDDSVACQILSSSYPTVSYVVYDENDNPKVQNLTDTDKRAIDLLMAPRPAIAGGEAFVPEHLPNSVYINIPLNSVAPTAKGHIALLITAKFSLAKQLSQDEGWVAELMPFVITLCIMLSGYLASKNFVRRLQHITSVSSAWREGDLDHRIIDNEADELSEHSQNLNAMAQQLKELLSLKQKSAIQDERTRMARELHDTVKQNLFALALQLAAINSKVPDLGEAKQNLLESRKILKQAQEQLVGVIAELQIISLRHKSFIQIFKIFCENLERKFNVPIHCIVPLDLVLPDCQFIVISRVIQESITNAIRHGNAKLIIISLIKSEMCFELLISDDGIGFDLTLPTNGMGIVSMRERVASFPAGRFSIETAPGEGATIRITWKEQPNAA